MSNLHTSIAHTAARGWQRVGVGSLRSGSADRMRKLPAAAS